MSSIPLVVGDVLAKKAPKVSGVKDHNMMEQLTANGSDPPLANSVLPGFSGAGTFRGRTQVSKEAKNYIAE
jgi:hypothetical protein